MPKLDGTHIQERLRGRLEELREGKEVSPRDLRALLTDEQVATMDAAWAAQQALRKQKRARTKEEEIALGWKSKRDIHIEAYVQAIAEADVGMLDTLENLQHKAQVRQANIYLTSYFAAQDLGKTDDVARNLANNDLTRAALQRINDQIYEFQDPRLKEIWLLEQQILQRARSEMTLDELEQLEIWEAHEKAMRDKANKLRD
jgi:hypothetical protein